MNILNKKFAKTSNKLKVIEKNAKLVIDNQSNKREKIIFIKSIKTKDGKINIKSKGTISSEENCTIKILNRKLRVVESVDINDEVFLDKLPSKIFLGLSIEPNSKIEITSFSIDDHSLDSEINYFFRGNILLICHLFSLI